MKTTIIIGLLALLLIGGAIATISTGPSTITVPSGKTAIYFTLNNADAVYLRDALCHNYGYQATITNESGYQIPNPQTCAVYGQQQIVRFARENMAAYHKWQYENGYASTDWTVTG